MPSATASGADAGGANGSAKHREHNQGNQERKYTVEQKAAVLRIRRCQPTAFYDILGIEAVKTTCSEAEIKKAYRKQSLLTHPDKNGHEHADEAFKMVSRAFGVLGDKEKREKFDRFGTDPDSRFESARAQAGNPFSGFGGGRPAGGGGPGFGGGNMWEEEISPEEMFQRFFGGGFGGPFGGFDTGPQFVFNLGGNRGFRVHQMGGAGPRRRPREAAAAGPQRETTGWDTLVSLLPIIFLFLFPLLTSVFSSGETQSPTPKMMFEMGAPPNTLHRRTPKHNIDYYINPQDVPGWTDYMFKQLDTQAEIKFTNELRFRCESEMRTREDLFSQAQGWFYQDPDKMRVARAFEMHSCKRLQKMGLRR
ncbi:J domain-containing protein [Apiospora kogelbergensis]|uniref:J domain-containing protein n=1 Tax=Apiospora kogelbergensis TaxID=1337665 RepID=A0AAW0R7R8_9PEZI